MLFPDPSNWSREGVGQEYNQRKKRKSELWEDRYHATVIEQSEHLARCLVYIDLNMVSAGVVEHPSARPFCGYSEIQAPKRKNALIDYDRLRELLDLKSYALVKQHYKGWIEEALRDGEKVRQSKWTTSVAVGSKSFIERVKAEMGARAIGKKIRKTGDVYHLREASAAYIGIFDTKNDDIGPINTHLWIVNDE